MEEIYMKDITQLIIHEGEYVKMYKDPGFYTIDFYPIVSIRIPEDQIKNVTKDLDKIIKNINKR
jgi:hypothetical protein